MRLLAWAATALALAVPGAGAATAPGVETPFPAPSASARMTKQQVVSRFLATPKVRDWLGRYPPRPRTDAEIVRSNGTWTVHVWSGKAGEIAVGRVEDVSGRVLEAWTGPQVAWKMARGGGAVFGGRLLNSAPVWIGFCVAFLVGLADLRRPLSLRTLDLLALVAFTVALWFINRGEVFQAMLVVYPLLVYLLGRCTWIGFRRRALPTRSWTWPVWLVVAAAVFLGGFRAGLSLAEGEVIDVGYASVIGADRILHGQAPYGNMPVEEGRKPCGAADADGRIRDRLQKNGRCETSNRHGDTYGPVVYLAYVPAVLWLGWSGKWDGLPAAHASAVAFDLLTVLGLVLVGLRFGGRRLAATLAFAWMAYPFTAYVLLSGTNDTVMPAALVWGFWLATSPVARGVATATAGWAKFGALLVAPLWLAYPDGLRRSVVLRFAGAFVAVTLVAFAILLLEPNPIGVATTFVDSTIGFQMSRHSPFSIWDWGQYHARGIPDLHVLQVLAAIGAVVLAAAAMGIPRRKAPLELAALTAAILLAFQLGLTHWFFFYLPWALPFLVMTLFLRRAEA